MRKTTVDLPRELVTAAKKKAAETGVSLRQLIEGALRRELFSPLPARARKPRNVRLVVSDGGLPPGLDVSNREKMYEWFEREEELERQKEHQDKQGEP